MRPWIAVLCATMPCALANAGDVEVAVRAGQVFPFYKQSFRFDPGPFLRSTFPNVVVEPVQDLSLEGRGGLAFGGGLTWYAAGGVGLEARVDTADVSVRSVDAIVRVRFPLPPPLPSLSTDVNIPATADLQRLRPVSLNLAARTPGNVKVRVSGGVSYLPSLRFSVRSDIRAAGPLVANLPLAHLLVRAEAQPGGEGELPECSQRANPVPGAIGPHPTRVRSCLGLVGSHLTGRASLRKRSPEPTRLARRH